MLCIHIFCTLDEREFMKKQCQTNNWNFLTINPLCIQKHYWKLFNGINEGFEKSAVLYCSIMFRSAQCWLTNYLLLVKTNQLKSRFFLISVKIKHSLFKAEKRMWLHHAYLHVFDEIEMKFVSTLIMLSVLWA